MPVLATFFTFLAVWLAPQQANRTQQLKEFADMRAKWEATRPRAYEYSSQDRDTLSIVLPGRHLTRIRVVGGVGTIVGRWSHALGDSARTIDDVFDDVQKWLEQRNNDVEITYDRRYSYPRSIMIHSQGCSEGSVIDVTSFEPVDTSARAEKVSAEMTDAAAEVTRTLAKHRGLRPPAGFRFPVNADYSGSWEEYRKTTPAPFVVRGDFTGDTIEDEAWLLPDTSGGSWAIYALIGAAQGQPRWIRIQRTPLFASQPGTSIPIQETGLGLLRPGHYRTLCGAGWALSCEQGEPSEVDPRSHGIELFFSFQDSSILWWESRSRRIRETSFID